MTGAQVLDLLMVRLNRTAAGVRTNCLTEMVFQQSTLEQSAELPWFLIGNEETLTVTAGTREVAVPSGFLREVDEIKTYIIDTDGAYIEMTKKDYVELEAYHGIEATSALPTDYDLVGTNFLLFPKPTVTTSIKGRFYKAQIAPTDDAVTTDKWLVYAPDLLLAITGETVAAQHLQNQELAMSFGLLRQKAEARLTAETVARAEAARTRTMG